MRSKFMLPTAAAVLTLMCSTPVFAAPVVVRCGTGQHAIVRDGFVRGHAITRVECVGGGYREGAYRTHYVTRYRVGHRHRSWGKSALIIGGGAGTGAGIGGVGNGKKSGRSGESVRRRASPLGLEFSVTRLPHARGGRCATLPPEVLAYAPRLSSRGPNTT